MAKRGLPWSRSGGAVRLPTRRHLRGCRRCGSGVPRRVGAPTGPRATRVSATGTRRFRPRSAHGSTRTRHAASRSSHPWLTRSAHSRCPERHAEHLRCVVSCSDTRCRAPAGTTAPPPPVSGTRELVSPLSNDRHLRHSGTTVLITLNDAFHGPLDRTATAPLSGARRGRSTGVARGRAHRRLRTHRRHADRRPGLPGRHGRLAVPAPLRLACHLRRAARHRGTRLLAARPRARVGRRAAHGRPAPLPRRLADPGVRVGHPTRHGPGDRLHAAA